MNHYPNVPNMKERLACSALYLGSFIPLIGWVPLVWIIVINVRKMHVKDFVKYHCYQSLLFNMVALFLPQLIGVLIEILSSFLDLFGFFGNTVALLNSGFSFIVPFYYLFIQIVSIYALIWTIRGKYTYLPPISQAINNLLR